MRLQQKNPKFVYEGFKHVFVPGLPDPEIIKEAEIKRQEEEKLNKKIEEEVEARVNQSELKVESLVSDHREVSDDNILVQKKGGFAA